MMITNNNQCTNVCNTDVLHGKIHCILKGLTNLISVI